jgi:3-oxoacyl-[acyl-carrier-protein] synthase III
VVSNDEISSLLDTSDDWIVERSGIRFRRVAAGPFASNRMQSSAPESIGTTGELAIRAARGALVTAGVRPDDIGMLVLCTATPDKQMPATSAVVAAELGITSGAMDLNAVCAGFMYGLITTAGLIAAGVDRVLLIGSETMTRAVNWSDRSSAFLFGDGAAAVVVETVEGPGSLLGWNLGVDGTLANLFYAEHGSGMTMKGPEVFRNAVRMTVESARRSMDRAGVKPSDIDLFVPHQANSRIFESVAARLGLSPDRIASIIERTGNTSSASIPLTLVDAIERGRLERGDLILFAGFGSGMAWGSAVWQWGEP